MWCMGTKHGLVAGRDYPRTYREFVGMFPDNQSCAVYLESLRWPDGFVCPACGDNATPWRQTRDRLACSHCRHQASVTASTIFDKTRTPLTTWFEAAWHVTTAKNGLSAKTLERTLGTSYRVAWTMLQRFRVAMVRAERERLSGEVEVDEMYVGGVEHGGKRGRGASKCIVVIAVEVKSPKGFGRIRMRYVPDVSGGSLVPFVCDVVTPGTVVLTDGWRGYNDLHKHDYERRKIIQSSSDDPPLMFPCPVCIAWPACSNGGFWGPIKERLPPNIFSRTWRSSPFVSTGEPAATAVLSSADFSNRPSSPSR